MITLPPRIGRPGAMRLAAFLAALCLTPAFAQVTVTTTLVDLPRAEGGTQRFLYVAPSGPVTANIVALSGGDGYLGIQDDGTMTNPPTSTCGPVTRNRQALAEAGFAIALMNEAPSDSSILEVIAYLRARRDVPTWVSGGSAATGTVAERIANLPASYPAGALFYSPDRMSVSDAQIAAVTRTAFVLYHANDSGNFGAGLYNRLVNAGTRERLVLQGGSADPPCGYHLFWGLDAEFMAGIVGFMRTYTPRLAAPNYQALWYAAPAESEPGWGVNVAHQGDTLFATWFTYDAAGPMWLVMSNGVKVGPGTYGGTLYRTTGPAFDAVPFDPARVAVSPVGSATFTFTAADQGTFAYAVNGVSGSKAITRQVYASPQPLCAPGTAPGDTNFQDLWWVPTESGWGVNVTHQGDTLFATWFTYGADGRGRWLVMSNLGRVPGTRRYSGDIYQTTGAPFGAYDPSRLVVSTVGSASFEFTGAANATFTYTLDGTTQSKAIQRQAFASPMTTCR